MTNAIPFDLDQYIGQQVASGRFGSREEFIFEAVQVYRELESRHSELRAEIQRRIEEADRGLLEPLDMEDIKSEGRRRLEQQPGTGKWEG